MSARLPTSQPTAPTRGAVNPWLVIAAIAIPVFVGSLDLTVVSAFLPELIISLEIPLQTGLDDAAWVVSGYLLAYLVSLTFTGRLSDVVGRRRVYVVCLLIFIVGSVLVAIAHTWPTDLLFGLYRRFGGRALGAETSANLIAIIFGRVVQAIGAGALVPVSLALVGDLFPPGRRAQPLGLVSALDTLGWVLGHLYGGLFVQIMPWQGLFWMNVPLTFIALAGVLYGLRNVPVRRANVRFDVLGTLFIVSAIVVLTLSLGANIDVSGATSLDNLRPLPSYAPYGIAVAVVLFALFVLVEARVRDPLIRLALFRERNFSAGGLANLAVGYCIMIGLVIVPFLVNARDANTDGTGLREAALTTGLLLSTLTVPMALAAVPGGWLAGRFGFRATTVTGLAMSAVGFALVWLMWDLNVTNLTMGLHMALVGTGIGLTFSPVSAAMINAASDDDRGVASALVLILRLLGMTLSFSTLTLYAQYRGNTLLGRQLGSLAIDSAESISAAINVIGTVLAELGLVGVVVCGIGIVPALLLSGRGAATEDYPSASTVAPEG